MLNKIEITKCDDSLNVGFAFIDENGDAMDWRELGPTEKDFVVDALTTGAEFFNGTRFFKNR